jgi:hypothetical protein
LNAEKKKTPKPIVFSFRRALPSDLKDFLPLLQGPFSQDATAQKNLLAFWRHLLESGADASGVVEDSSQPQGKRTVGFGISFFATPKFAQETKTAPPFLPLRAAEKWRQGSRPYLTREEIAKANAGEGLICVPVNFGMALGRYGAEAFPKLQEATLQLFFRVHGGYQITEFLEEVYGDYLMENFKVMGLSTLRDYGGYQAEPHHAPLTGENRPYLMGIRRDQALDWKSNHVFTFFAQYTKPRFYFRAGEQAALEEALAGGTDEETAKKFRRSLWSVKKRWRTIYEKVMGVDPELLDGVSLPGVKDEGRLRQKRRHLLNYLQGHPEELRPLAVPRRKRAY